MKDHQDDMRFVMVTGVTKLAKMSIFSGFNNPTDLTLNAGFAGMLGYTHDEVERYFHDQVQAFADKEGIDYGAMKARLFAWYDSYRFSPESDVKGVNPFSFGSALNDRMLSNYWEKSGNSGAILKRIRAAREIPSDLNGAEVSRSALDTPTPESEPLPVLMYHAVGDEIWGYSDLFVSEAGMEEQLQYLQENGYEPIWFSDLTHIEDYEKPVILTFDDGYDDNYTVLYPLLEKYQTKATIFVIGNAMGSQHKMTQEQVYELAASGLVSIQSHTYTHGNLSAMDEPALRQEMERANAALAAATGHPVRAVLPGGQIQSPDDGRGEGLLHICPAHGRLDLSDRHGPVSGAAQLRLTPHHAAGLSVVPRPVRKSVLKTNAQPAAQAVRLQHVIIRADILVMSVFHAEAAGDNAELDKSKALIQVPRVRVGRDDGVELLFRFSSGGRSARRSRAARC